MSKKSTGLQSWGEINIPSASKLGQHNKKADINLENSCISTKAKCQRVWKVTGRRNGSYISSLSWIHKTYGRRDVLNESGRWWICCRTDGPQLLEKYQPCLHFLHKHRQDKDLSLTGKGEWDSLQWLWFSGYSQRIDKAGREIPEAPGQRGSRVALSFTPWSKGRPKLWNPGFLPAPATNSKIQTESQKEWKMMGFVDNRRSPQGIVAVPELFPVGWEGLGTFEECGEQNYPNKHLLWIVLTKEQSWRREEDFSLLPNTFSQNGLGSTGP